MSNCYTHFAEQLKLSGKTQENWVRKQLETAWVTEDGSVYQDEPGSACAMGYSQAALFLCNAIVQGEMEYDELEELFDEVGFSYEFHDDGEGHRLEIYDEESGNPNSVAHFVQQFMKKFHPKDTAYWAMTWAETGDKGPFGGGWMMISATRREMAGTSDELANRMRAPWTKGKKDLSGS